MRGWFAERKRLKSLNKSLFDAVDAGEVAAVAKLLDQGADPNAVRRKSYPRVDKRSRQLVSPVLPGTPLTVAAWQGDIATLELLLTRGADCNALGATCYPGLCNVLGVSYASLHLLGVTPALACRALVLGILRRHAHVVDALLKAGASIRWTREHGKEWIPVQDYYALHLAVLVGDAKILLLVIAAMEQLVGLVWPLSTLLWSMCFWGRPLVLHLVSRGVRWHNTSSTQVHASVLRLSASLSCTQVLLDAGLDMRVISRIYSDQHINGVVGTNLKLHNKDFPENGQWSLLDASTDVYLDYPFYEPTLRKHAKSWKRIWMTLLCFHRMCATGRLVRNVVPMILSANDEVALDVLSCILRGTIKKRFSGGVWTCNPNQLRFIRERIGAQQLLTRPCVVRLFLADFLVKSRILLSSSVALRFYDSVKVEECIMRHLFEQAVPHVVTPLRARDSKMIGYALRNDPGQHPLISIGPMTVFIIIKDTPDR